MHDPSTVAHEIKNPISWIASKFKPKGGGALGGYRYVKPLITIWHEDPMEWGDHVRGRSDDSCGWFVPPMLKSDVPKWEKHAELQYGELFRRTKATAEGEDWAYVAYDAPDCYTAIYWLWRAIKHEHLKGTWWYRQLWQYGNAPTPGEQEAIMNLASNPVDNLQFSFEREAKRPPGASDRNGGDFMSFYWSVLRAYRRHHRSWWRHPRWHVHHWRFQVHPWRQLRRWAFSRCSGCGKRFAWGYAPITHSWDSQRPKMFCSEVDVWHKECDDRRHGKLKQQQAAGTA